MATWFSVSTPQEVARFVAAWGGVDAPTDELGAMLLDIARDQVLAYAPEFPETGEVVPGPVTIDRRNLLRDPALATWNPSRVTRVVADGVAAVTVSELGYFPRLNSHTIAVAPGEPFSASCEIVGTGVHRVGVQYLNAQAAPVNTPGQIAGTLSEGSGIGARIGGVSVVPLGAVVANIWLGVPDNSPIGVVGRFARPLAEKRSTLAAYFDGGTPPVTVGNRTFSHSWEGVENASTSVETYRPDTFVRSYPDRLVYAQLQQAKNLWAAGRSDGDGSIGSEGYSFQPRPLDKTIRQIIRPTSGVPDVF